MVARDLKHADLMRQYDLLRSDPEKFLELVQQFVAQNPDDPTVYFTRHKAWTHLGQMELALADLDRSLALEKHYTTYEARGNLLRRMGRYLEAVADFNTSETLDCETWLGGFGPLFRAECPARLGNLDAALADCATLPDDHWTPGIHEAPGAISRMSRRGFVGSRPPLFRHRKSPLHDRSVSRGLPKAKSRPAVGGPCNRGENAELSLPSAFGR